EYRDEIKIVELKENFNGMSTEIRKKEKLLQQEQWAYLSTHPSKRLNSFCYNDEDYTSAITPFGSNDDSTSIDDDSFYIDNIEYVEASPLDSELVSLEVMEILIPKVGGIDDDILLTIRYDILREKLLNINLLIANIKALKDNPTPSSNFMTKSSSTSLNFLLEETNTFDNSLLESETFCVDLEEIISGSTTTRFDISLPNYEAFYDDHVKRLVVAVSLLIMILLFMIRSSLIFRSIHVLLPLGVTFIMRSLPMNSLTMFCPLIPLFN
nr:hypothetical protein [Tanacetum cinerariifolium]